jgi:hypothetical protein
MTTHDIITRQITRALASKRAFFDVPLDKDDRLNASVSAYIYCEFPMLAQYGPAYRVTNECGAVCKRKVDCPMTSCHCDPTHLRIPLPASAPSNL